MIANMDGYMIPEDVSDFEKMYGTADTNAMEHSNVTNDVTTQD